MAQERSALILMTRTGPRATPAANCGPPGCPRGAWPVVSSQPSETTPTCESLLPSEGSILRGHKSLDITEWD